MFRVRPSEHEAGVLRAASWLDALDRSDHGDLVLEGVNHPALIEAAHAGLRLGIPTAILSPYLTEPERTRLLGLLNPLVPPLDPRSRPWEGAAAHPDLPRWPRSRPMLATSGTSGAPRLVEPAMLGPEEASVIHEDEAELWRPDPDRVQLVCSPLFHSAGYRSATSALLAGGEVLLHERFDAAPVMRSLRDEPIAGAFLVPTQLRRILELQPDPLPPEDRRLLHAGEPCPARLREEASTILGPLSEFYGSTEGQFTLLDPAERVEHPDSVGRARRGRTIEIRDPGADGVGTVWCDTPWFTRWTYRRDDAATMAAWDGDAFTVGDLGSLSPDGFLTLASRREDLIISGGVNIYPAMIEGAVCEHPGIEAAVAVGLPDERWGQALNLAVLSRLGPDEVEAWLRSRLAGPHLPKRLEVWQDLPRTASGKVDRAHIRRRLAGESR
jgi:long-chain acyl-CoA synthetase